MIQRWFKEYAIETEVNVQKLTNLTADRSVAQIKELVISAAKRYVTTDNPVTMDDMIELLIQQMTNNSNGAGVVDAAAELKAKGVSVRTLAKAIGMPHNTLSYQINKLMKGKEVDE